jgi:hypothetical protein
MKCPYCGIAFHDDWGVQPMNGARKGSVIAANSPTPSTIWFYRTTSCPQCHELTVEIGTGQFLQPVGNVFLDIQIAWQRALPIASARTKPSPNIPPAIAADYLEACSVLTLSPKASAALSRRCLQHMLRGHGYKAKDLAHEIDLLLGEQRSGKSLPHRSRSAVDAIRNFGNFSAHPTENKASLEVIDVEEHEAESCLETIEELFDHFYDGPAVARERQKKLDAKLAAAGKPPSKG